MEAAVEAEVENEDGDSSCGDVCFMDKGLQSCYFLNVTHVFGLRTLSLIFTAIRKLIFLISDFMQLILENMPVVPSPIELPPLEQFANTPADTVLTSFLSVCPSSEPEKINHEKEFQNERKLQKLDDRLLQLLNETSTTLIDNVPEKDLRPKRDTDITSESDYGNKKECSRKVPRRSKIPYYARSIQTIKHHNRNNNIFVSCNRKIKQPYFKDLYVRSSLANCNFLQELEEQKNEIIKVENNIAEDNTYRSLVEQLDQEREMRWKAEQAEKKLMEYIDELHKQANEKKDVHSLALLTTDRLKDIIFRERTAKAQLEVMVHKLQNEIKKLTIELIKARDQQEDHIRHLRTLEKALEKMERQKGQQQAAQIRLLQEVEIKAAAADREINLLRTSLHQEKEQVQQLHELLALKEQEHRKELETREFFSDAEFQEALAKEISKEERKHEQEIKKYHNKVDILNQQYLDLENEFRIALTVEARRFKEVKDGFENVATELAKSKHALIWAQRKENESSSLIKDLTYMVKEQKSKLAEVSKLKQETAANLQNQINTLEILIEDDKQKSIQIELLKHDKVQLISELAAKESLIYGLRTERKVWGHELAQQGSTLAQNRGKLEAQIESLSRENESLRKGNERDIDALRIKCKIIEDQTETIAKLKLQEKDEQIKILQEKITQIEKSAQEQLDKKCAQLDSIIEKLERHNERKEKLKQQLKTKELELDEIRKAYSTLNQKWHDKGELLCHLETQVKEAKVKFENKEKKLKAERDKSIELQNTFSYVTHEDICNCFNGDTLLAIQAPSGTQLEVPIPEMGQNGQKKYQINLKSHSGPIHVLLINKESSSSKPVVFPVPPPDDLTQPSSQSSTPVTPQKSNIAAQNLPEQHVSERSQNLQQIPATEISSAGSLSGDIIDELMSSDVFPLLRLSPTPADDYNFNLDDNEGVCDLFDVQILNY
ncbi:Leucine-rich repeat and coiled-coil domain-containing protein 1 [Sciurus carolinensis]|uniref:Leucine-rich repeat and coiled-coil domain-containing protein 1 n=1 Tax=Sciurus carolinensis TaxID=30640 RepID=A0AA41TAH4_SCICA|nr:Leucine-rich repeat and coiled-coil domain-containing protein 1 [Sciurus carolinensis]